MKSNTRFNKNKRGIECLNCKQPLSSIDNFCSNCGQVNDLRPLSIKQFILELLGGLFAFDTRSIKTLIQLITKPGKVTQEYINGNRIKYVNPFQLYLHVSIIFFLFTGIYSTISEYNDIIKGKERNNIKINNYEGNLSVSYSSQTKEEKTTNDEVEKLISNKIDSTFFNINTIELLNNHLISKKYKDSIVSIKSYENVKQITKIIDSLNNIKYSNDDILISEYLTQFKQKLKKSKYNYVVNSNLLNDNYSLQVFKYFTSFIFEKQTSKKIDAFYNVEIDDVGKALDSLKYPVSEKNIYLFKKVKEFKTDNSGKHLENKAYSKLPIVLFLILPVFALVLWLFFIRHKITYTEHLIFVFNIQTVFFLFQLLGSILEVITNIGYITYVLFFLFFGYLFIALHNFYNQSLLKTSIKYVLINLVLLIVSILGLFFITFLAFIM
ncbi:MAG TPA: DUF3667 domain-containing protein [Flavobacteriaceae bacterium]|nr:DUF3667 domain-containing protein [Flavobacteriaceae bacterium]